MSQTRVCEPPQPGLLIHRLIYMDRSGAEQQLVRQGTLSREPDEGAGPGTFPDRWPSLTEQQREYIRLERSKVVSQRELAKRLEVSRWTVQQVGR